MFVNRSYRNCDACRKLEVVSYVRPAIVNSSPELKCRKHSLVMFLYDAVNVVNCNFKAQLHETGSRSAVIYEEFKQVMVL